MVGVSELVAGVEASPSGENFCPSGNAMKLWRMLLSMQQVEFPSKRQAKRAVARHLRQYVDCCEYTPEKAWRTIGRFGWLERTSTGAQIRQPEYV